MSGEQSASPIPIPTSVPIPDGYTQALPPWDLQAEAWWILPPIPLPWQSKELPKGALDPHEAGRYAELEATYTGGLGTIQLLRYQSSPVGPYDELLYVPGKMAYKGGVSGLSLTRIYVSTLASLVNGRRNWNIPKQLARFEFTRDSSDPLSPVTAAVFPALGEGPEFAAEPVFRARLVPSRTLPNFPLNLGQVPRVILDPRLFQPPLTNAGGTLVGTEEWCSVAPGYKGQVRVLYPEPGLNGKFGDGVGFPDVHPLSVGLWWSKATITFPPAVILEPASEDKKTK